MAKFNKEKILVHKWDNFDWHDLDGINLAVLAEKIEQWRKKLGEESALHIDLDSDGYDCYPTITMSIRSVRLETDKEYAIREEQHKVTEKHRRDEAKKRKLVREECDRAEYERLSKKFGSRSK